MTTGCAINSIIMLVFQVNEKKKKRLFSQTLPLLKSRKFTVVFHCKRYLMMDVAHWFSETKNKYMNGKHISVPIWVITSEELMDRRRFL